MNTDPAIIKSHDTKCFLMKAKDGYLLVDTGYVWRQEAFVGQLRKQNVAVREIRHIFLTHYHDDHSGLLNYFVSENPDVRIILHKSGKDLLLIGRNTYDRNACVPTRRCAKSWHVLDLFSNQTGRVPPYAVRETDILQEEDDDALLRELGIDGKIILTPGHSPDSMCILLDNGDLYAGDAAMSSWPALLTGCKYTTIAILDLDMYYDSWQKIIDCGAKVVHPAHGKPFSVKKLEENHRKIKKLWPSPKSRPVRKWRSARAAAKTKKDAERAERRERI
ncbi:MAG: MBL fold metallo-hydrolase [Clostridiales Family XIII bacterium]|nr:MBL fold metallo-hydrolase [Clostridiales Family XIII bacterium]